MFVRCKSLSASMRASRAKIFPACLRPFREKIRAAQIRRLPASVGWPSAQKRLKYLDFIGHSAYAKHRKNTPRGIDWINARTETIN
jgi:hypothetical protein